MFKEDDYNDNVEYCRYVWEKNLELGLNLNSSLEIQLIANSYVDEVISRRGFDEDEVFKNDKILLSVVEKNAKKLRKFKPIDEREIDIKLASEKELNRFGGYGYNDSFDDHGLDEIEEDSRSL